MEFPIYLVVMQNDNKYYLLASKPGVVQAFQTQNEAIEYFEKPYREAHRRSYERSMSACISFMSFMPSVISINSDKEFYSFFKGNEARYVTISNVSGGFCGAVTKTNLKKLFENGVKPSLYKENW